LTSRHAKSQRYRHAKPCRPVVATLLRSAPASNANAPIFLRFVDRRGAPSAEPPSAQHLATLLAAERDLPREGLPLEDVLQTCGALLDAGRRPTPAFFGYVLSPPSPVGIAADLLASAAGQNVTAWRSAPAATAVEHIAIRWLGRLVGFADDAAGIMLSGGSLANLSALHIALHATGRSQLHRRDLVVYASAETHFSLAKACDVLGVALRSVPTDGARRIDVAALRIAIEDDRRHGRHPVCVVANAGTTATGAVDDIAAAADVAGEHGLWLHVDGAYGAPAAADPASRDLFAGIERADSLAVDAHKWLYAPVDCGVLLLRSAADSARAFAAGRAGDYVRILTEGDDEAFAFWDHGIELSRRFRALKLWMTLRLHGADTIAAAIAEDIAMARHMAALVREDPQFELLTEPSLSICCFRHTPPGMARDRLDDHNRRLLAALQRDGRVYLSNATLDGRFALRACITNFRTTRADVEATLAVLRELGARQAGA
jgi:glutamate/tyrosine decarboxylase-like PLP-dependent enzyme